MRKLCLLSLLFWAIPARAEERHELLDLAIEPPRTAFTGKKLVVSWYGEKSRAVETRVYFEPPNKWRHEVLNATGNPSQTTIQNGMKGWVIRQDYDVVLERDVKQINRGDLNRKDLRKLLADNFSFKFIGERDLFGVKARGISLLPKEKAGPHRTLWVDPETGIVLHRRQSNHRGRLVQESRLVNLKIEGDLPNSLFTLDPEEKRSVVKEENRPDLRSARELEARGFPKGLWREELPYGYQLDSVRIVSVSDDVEILHFRYTNGLTQISLFLSPYEIETSDVPTLPGETDDDGEFALRSWAGNVLSWEEAGRYYMLVGDLAKKGLIQLRKTLLSARP